MSDGWPAIVFDAPLLRGLDARGRREVERAGSLRAVVAGESIYRRGERGAALYVVARGEVILSGVARGEERPRSLRAAAPGESFGEEASVGASFRADAQVRVDGELAEIPVAMLRRALGRAGGSAVADRIERRLHRRATAELFSTASFTARLGDDDRAILLDAAEHRTFSRGETVYRDGDPPDHLWLVADGLVQLQVREEARSRVRAYLSPGDLFGDEEVIRGTPRGATAIANGPSLLVAIPAAAARAVAERQPRLLEASRRVTGDAPTSAVAGPTLHPFSDLYRLTVARSLLVIDLDACVRCGHCAWSCASLHGVARIARHGDVVRTAVGTERQASPLLLPSSCQHCEHPACMVDCPTGAIGRDLQGEVQIDDALCTGCGACVKACPWDNVQLAPRPPSTPSGEHPLLAVKCDLCRGYEAPACVESCPTSAMARLDPAVDLPAVARRTDRVDRVAPRGDPWLGWALPAAVVATALAAGQRVERGWTAGEGVGWGLGIMAGATFAAAIGYALPKRLRRRPVRRKRPRREAEVRSRLRPHLRAHLAIGIVALAAAAGHGGVSPQVSVGAALWWATLAGGVLGAFGALAYAILPARLARLERRAILPEDLTAHARALHDRLYGAVSGRSEVVKKLFERVFVPYLRRPFGALRLLLAGGDLAGERDLLRGRVDAVLAGRRSDRLAGLEEVIDLAVEIRATRAQRIGVFALRGWLPLHLVAVAIATVLLVVHVVLGVT